MIPAEQITAALTEGPIAEKLATRATEDGVTYTSEEVARLIELHYSRAGADLAWLGELTEEQRVSLPAVFHRPYFNGLVEPHSWCCEACWGDGWSQQWPCTAAVLGGLELAKSLGVEWSW